MRTCWRWISIAALACGVTQSANSQNIAPISERVARLPDTDFRAWFGSMLLSEYLKGTEWEAFFGDVGPTEGCSALRDIKNQIIQDDLAAFKAAYVEAVSKGMSPEVFSDIPDSLLAVRFSSRIERFQKNLSKFLQPHALEMGKAGRQWANSHGYRGRRLGYNVAGIPYWRGQAAMTTLVCQFPNDLGFLRGWKD